MAGIIRKEFAETWSGSEREESTINISAEREGGHIGADELKLIQTSIVNEVRLLGLCAAVVFLERKWSGRVLNGQAHQALRRRGRKATHKSLSV